MSSSLPDSSEAEPPRDLTEAGVWIWRLERGLSPAEQDQFFEWLAADPAHAEALESFRHEWRRMNKLTDWRPEHSDRPNPDLLAPARGGRWRTYLIPVTFAAAACIAVVAWWRAPSADPVIEAALPRHEDRRTLPDESTVKLNADAKITVLYSSVERRIRLEKGEAFFQVVPETARPFVVEASGVNVRALGTAFNVALGATQVDVLVAEGTVAIAPGPATEAAEPVGKPAPELAVLRASQQARISLAKAVPAPDVATLSRQEIQRRLAWQHGLMTFREERLAAIASELNRLNETQLILADGPLADSRFSGTIRSNNVEGFARLLETGFGASMEKLPNGDIRLKAKLGSN